MASRNPESSSPEVNALFDPFLAELARRLAEPVERRNELCRDLLVQIYLGGESDYAALLADPALPLATRALVASMDPRNVTLEPEHYAEMDEERYYRVKPLLWFWQMFDHSPLGHNCRLGFRVRYLLAQHIFERIGRNVRFFRGVEFSFGYNMSVGSNVTFHRFVLVDDRGPVIMGDHVSLSDWANVYTHTHDVEDIGAVEIRPTLLDDGVRVAYHATVLAGAHLERDSMVGAMGVATRGLLPHHVAVGIPARAILVKKQAREDPDYDGPYEVAPIQRRKP